MVEYVGIDIGGTNIRIGAINNKEDVIFEYKEPTFKDVITGEDLYKKIKNLIKTVPNYENVKAIGIGVPGSVDEKLGRMKTSTNLNILCDFPLVQKLNEDFNRLVFIENDARVATFAEAIKGKGKGKNIVCYITVSTGLGGGVLKSKDRFLPEVISNFKNKAHQLAKDTIIEVTEFEEPGTIGAALLAKSELNKRIGRNN